MLENKCRDDKDKGALHLAHGGTPSRGLPYTKCCNHDQPLQLHRVVIAVETWVGKLDYISRFNMRFNLLHKSPSLSDSPTEPGRTIRKNARSSCLLSYPYEQALLGYVDWPSPSDDLQKQNSKCINIRFFIHHSVHEVLWCQISAKRMFLQSFIQYSSARNKKSVVLILPKSPFYGDDRVVSPLLREPFCKSKIRNLWWRQLVCDSVALQLEFLTTS